jgi:hypothetical protein
LQRLPRGTIERAQVRDKVLLQEHPGAAHFGPRNASCLGPIAQLLGVDPQELRGFGEAKSAHMNPPWTASAPMVKAPREKAEGRQMPPGGRHND